MAPDAGQPPGVPPLPGTYGHDDRSVPDDPNHLPPPGIVGLPSILDPATAHRFLTLPNGLRVLLISDPSADKAAASLEVAAGSLLEPDDVPGLAHLTEHMLFYSSVKYPEEDDYSKFIQECCARGGHTNAYTASEATNYSFDINAEHLAPALDRFAQFFIQPLISRDGVEREVNAVDSEHGKNLQLDVWRHLELCKHVANPAHPWARFATGNLETLLTHTRARGIDVRDRVVEFHAKHYSANQMSLAVLGRQPLEELQALVEATFNDVPNHGLPTPTFASDVFRDDQLGTLLHVVPVKQTHVCEWAWQVPPSQPLYRKQPLGYLSHLLGHEGEGSIYSLLRKRGWATALVAGESGASISSASFCFIRVEMTEEGQQHVQDIGAVIFSYLALLRAQGITRAVYDENAALQRLRLDYRDKMAPYAYVTTLSSAMQLYPPQDLLLALYNVPQEWDPKCIREVLDAMTVDKVRVVWTSKIHEPVATDKEPWYGTRYRQEALPEDWVAAWRGAEAASPPSQGELHLPAPNPFIPSDLTLRTEDAAASQDASPGPAILQEEPGLLRLWHRCDLTFSTPKAVLYVDFQAPEAYTTPRAAVATRLVVKLLADALSELSYPADLAGLVYDVSNSQSGFLVTVSGYSHKLPVLLEAILDRLQHLKVAPDRFSVMAEQTRREYHNMRHSQPYSWAMYRMGLLLNLRRWSSAEYEEALPTITPDELQDFKTRLLSQLFVEAMYVGNVSRAEASAMGAALLDRLRSGIGARPVSSSQVRDLRAVHLPQGREVVLEEAGPDPDNTNAAVSIVYQVGPDDPSLSRPAALELLAHLSKREAFNVLRTQQQLGYIVHLFSSQELGIHQLELLVQSNAYPPAELLSRMDAFMHTLVTATLPSKCGLPTSAGPANGENAAAPEFEAAVSELCKALLEKPKRLGELAQRWWNAVFMGTYAFNRKERLAAAVRSLTPQQLADFWAEVVSEPGTRRKAVAAIHSAASAAAAGQPLATSGGPDSERVSDLGEFKRGLEAWPSVAGLYSAWRRRGQLPDDTTAVPTKAPPPDMPSELQAPKP